MLKQLCVTFGVLFVANVSFAQQPADKAPTVSDDPRATVACKIAYGFYWECHPTSESPEGQGIGAAAARLAACLTSSKKSNSADPEVEIPIRFKGLTPQQVVGSVDCPFDPDLKVNAPDLGTILQRRPTGAEILRSDEYLPPKVHHQRIEGASVIDCEVIGGKYKNCKIVREAPRGFGFGAAALKMSEFYQVAPLDKDGRPVEGRHVNVAIWRSDD